MAVGNGRLTVEMADNSNKSNRSIRLNLSIAVHTCIILNRPNKMLPQSIKIIALLFLGLRTCVAFVPHQYHGPKRVASASLNLFPKKERDPSIELTDEQDQALRAVAKDFDVLYGPRWFDDGEAWEKARSQYGVLGGYTDEELRTAFIRQGPRLVDVLIETPLGPFILINLLAYFTGFSWCDTPWHAEGACVGR